MRTACGLLIALFMASPQGVQAQLLRYLAYGDSITEGFNDAADCRACDNPAMTPPGCGYPKATRLPSASMLNCAANSCEIVNHGLFARKTGEDITRLNNILAGDPEWDVLLLMHGSNDLFAPSPIPVETVRDNLKQMAYDAAELGIDTVHASIIRFHYLGDYGMSRDGLVDQLGNSVQTLAANENRYFVDQRTRLCGTLTGGDYTWCQNFLYCEDNPDGATTAQKWAIGHPNPTGFDSMADEFSDTIKALGVPAAPGNVCVVPPTLTWSKESPDRATWYQVDLETDMGATVFQNWLPEAEISDIPTFGDPAIPGACSGSTCSVSLSPLAPGDYVLRVRGRNPQGRSAFSAPFPFRVPWESAGDYPTGDLLTKTPTYRWEKVPGATDYVLEGTIPATSTAGFTCNGSSCSVKPASPMLALGDYSWTVRPVNSCGSGDASAPVAFSIVSCTHAGDLVLENDLVNTTVTKDACGTIQAGNLGAGDYVVEATGDLTLHSGVSVALHNGFRAEAGSQVTILADQ